MPKTAVDALARLAVVAAQLDKGLAGQGVVTLDAGIAKHGDDAVLLGADVLEQGDGAVGHPVVVGHLATGVVEWGNGVDEHDVDAAVAQRTARARRRLAEGVMRRPIAAQLDVKQRPQRLGVAGVEYVVHQVETALDKLGKQGDAAVGEILRTAAEQAPCRALDGAQREFVGKEGILAHQLLVIALTAVGTVEQPGLPEEQCLDL